MSIRQRASGHWQVRVSDGSGRRLERTLPPTASRADAQALEALLVRRRVDTAIGVKPRRLIDEALAEWEPMARRLKSWDRDLKYRVNVLRQYTAGRYLDEAPDVAEKLARTGLASGLSPAAVNRYLAMLRRVTNLAFKRWGWIDVPYGQRIALVPGERSRDVWLDPADALAIIQACDSPEVVDAIMFAALTGLRRGELLALQPSQIRDGTIMLTANTKSGKPRQVPLHPVALQIAQDRLPWRLTRVMLRKAFERAREAAGRPAVRFHDLRHAFGSWLDASGASAAEIRDLLGHSSLTVSSKYVQTPQAHLRLAVSRLPDLRVSSGSERSDDAPGKKASNG